MLDNVTCPPVYPFGLEVRDDFCPPRVVERSGGVGDGGRSELGLVSSKAPFAKVVVWNVLGGVRISGIESDDSTAS